MGAEAACTGTFKGKTSRGKARLESETLEFRAPAFRVSIPFKEISKVTARDGALAVRSGQGTLSLALGAAAEKWALKIQHPRSRLEKIGVKAPWRFKSTMRRSSRSSPRRWRRSRSAASSTAATRSSSA